MSIPSDAQLGQDSPSGSPGISGETPGGQGRTEPLSASLTDSEADRTGRAAYAAYARLRTEQMADGRVYPAWDELDLTERFAWEAAGAAGLDAGASAVAAAERAKLQPAIDRVQHLATAAQAKAIEHAVAGERERCAVLAEAREATYDLTKPCGCGRTHPGTGRPCTALIRSGQPFADLIRKGDDG